MGGNLASIAMMDLAQTRFTPDPDNQGIERGLGLARDKGWQVMLIDRPGKFQITRAGFETATTA
jgi:hypothetical protein